MLAFCGNFVLKSAFSLIFSHGDPMADEPARLHQEITAAKRLREDLAQFFEDDPQLAADMIEGETNLNEAILAACDLFHRDKCAVEAIEAHIQAMEARKERIKKRIDGIRVLVGVALEQAGRKSVETALGTATLKSVPRSLIVRSEDEPDIPLDYWKMAKPSLDRKRLLADLKSGKTIKGACLSNGGQTVAFTFK